MIVATGARANYLGLPSEEEYKNKGVSACAVCDGALPIYRGKPLAVVGGGDSAVEEATYLANLDRAETIYMIVRRDEMRASKVMQDRAMNHPKIEILWNSVVDEVVGDGKQVTGLKLKSTAGRFAAGSGGRRHVCRHWPHPQHGVPRWRGRNEQQRLHSVDPAVPHATPASAVFLPPATSRTTTIVKRSRRPEPVAWPPSMPNVTWPNWKAKSLASMQISGNTFHPPSRGSETSLRVAGEGAIGSSAEHVLRDPSQSPFLGFDPPGGRVM